MEAALLGVSPCPSWLPAAPSSKARKGQDRAQAAQQAPGCADVLLITDGEVWDTKRMIASAQRSGHRVFVIGVGTSPAEAVLRHLAEATGGACEFATPGEALEAAAAGCCSACARAYGQACGWIGAWPRRRSGSCPFSSGHWGGHAAGPWRVRCHGRAGTDGGR